MKTKIITLFAAAAFVLTFGFSVSSCSDDNFTESIFDTTEHPLDEAQYTFPLDTFLKVNFLEPYNLRFIYRMQDIGSDMQKNLVPAAYDKSVDLAVLAKYLWFDVYKELCGELFLKKYSPKIIHVIGSPSYEDTGAETLGVAEGGVKITLMKCNKLDVENIDGLNTYFFNTMHHEFAHILDQNILRPTTFDEVSAGKYDYSSWTEKQDSVVASAGFVSPYASSQAREDWAEIISNYITRDSVDWNNLLASASYDWEEIDVENEQFYRQLFRGTPGVDYSLDTIGYYYKNKSGQSKVYRRLCARNADGTVALDEFGNVQYINNDGIDGREIILKKLQMAREHLKVNFGVDIDAVRDMVQKRQYLTNLDGTFVTEDGYDINSFPIKTFVNRLIKETYEGSGVKLIDSLRQQVYRYAEELHNH